MASRTFVALDLETTGLKPGRDRITEVGAVRFNLDRVETTFSTLINPGMPIPYVVEQLTGISDADVRDAPHFDSVRLDIEGFIADAAVVGHNVAFDLAFLEDAGIIPPGPAFDTFELATLLQPQEREHNLEALARRLGVETPVRHRALADAETSRQVFLALYHSARDLPADLLADLLALGACADWPLVELLREFVPARDVLRPAGRVRPAPPGEPATGVDASELPSRPPALGGVVPPLDGDAAVRVLAAGARNPEPFGAFEERAEQIGMTRAVAQALGAGRHLVVEAGTGTGKTLAYLIPAALYALREGARVIISTNTINLQEQVLEKDVPALRRLLADAVGAEVAAALRVAPLKGRRNYLCRRRLLAERWAESNTTADVRLLARILLWLRTTETGDRAGFRLLPGEDAIWNRFSAEGEDCLAGGTCSFVRDGSCFLLRARRRAEAAHIVVVNHALLLSDLAAGGTALPAADTVIIDEAHHLEEEATQHLGASFSGESFREPLERLHRTGPRGAPAGLAAAVRGKAQAAGCADVAALAEALPGATRAAADALDSLFADLLAFTDEHSDDRFGAEQRLRLTAGRRAQPAWSRVEIVWESAWERLRALDDRLHRLHEALLEIAPSALPDAEDLAAEVDALRDLLADRAEQCGRLLTQLDDALITWLTASARTGAIRISAAPLRVADLLTEQLFGRRRCVVLTGATLSAEGRFDFLRHSVGLEEADEARFGSPFDYRRAVTLLLPTDVPGPADPAYGHAVQEMLIDLILASEGRALALFTSHAALRAAAKAIRRPLQEAGILVLAQGIDGAPARLLSTLAENPRAAVLGTASLWEGVDMPGPSVSLVVIARLPFSVPTDPVFAARSELFEDSFREYSLPRAIVRFRQGFGRLIRRRDDRGVVVVLDGRIIAKGYGEAFVRSLPPVSVRRLPARDLASFAAEWLHR